MMLVEVVYIEPGKEFIVNVSLSLGATVEDAVHKSKLLEQFNHISLEKNSIGIFGKEVPINTVLQPNDRVEVYRPLSKDPKESRRLRAEFQREA